MTNPLEDGQMISMDHDEAYEETLNPEADSEDIDSTEITPDHAPTPVKISDVEEAMAELGMTKLNVGKWKAQTTLTQYLEEIGATRVGIGEYAVSNYLRTEVIQKCRDLIASCTKPFEGAVLAGTIGKLLDGRDKTTGEMIKAANSIELGKKEEPEGPRSAPRRTQIIAVQVNTDKPVDVTSNQ